MRNRGREFMVGIVFFALMGALGVITLVLSQDLLKSRETRVFRFTDVAGLTHGSEVWINGLPSGTVKEVVLNTDGTVSATTSLKNGLEGLDLSRGTRVLVKPKSALGGSVISVEIDGGKTGVKTLEAVLDTVWPATKDPFVTVGEKAEEMGESLRALLERIEEGEGTLARLIGDREMADSLVKSVKNIETVTDRLAAGEGTLGKLSKDEEAWNRLNRTLEKLDQAASAVTEGKGPLHTLLYDEKAAADLQGALSDIRSISGRLERGEGTFGRLLRDEGAYDDLRASLSDLRAFTADLREGKGLLGRLVNDEALADEAEATLRDLHGIVADVRAGKGTLGKFVTDEGLYNDVRDAMRSLQRTSEESRENAPILTFAGFLFRTF